MSKSINDPPGLEEEYGDEDYVEDEEYVEEEEEKEEKDLDEEFGEYKGEAPEATTQSQREKLISKSLTLARAVLGEFVITTIFMFVVTVTNIQYNRASSLNNPNVTVYNPSVSALAAALSAVGVIYSFADVSGANFNPAVTFATVVTLKTSILKGIFYILAQLFGATFAALLLAACFPHGVSRVREVAVVPQDDVTLGQTFWIEVVISFIFVYVIFATAFDTVETVKVSDKNVVVGRSTVRYKVSGNSKAGFAPLAIGFTLGACVFASGSISGGAFNPARVFGFALVGDQWKKHWLYWVADFLGAGLAGYVQKIFSKPRATPPKITDVHSLFRFLCYDRQEVEQINYKHMLTTWAIG
eukprot:TRINITY_DN537_c0_g2_i1.p1 TRINITY_DN537_c0_g2~~TRINITY_DN537_c0_g2_i1.p1  ORF type:complete len:357 (+),score=95.07 TRINITY_DN537_c0_g2_i1:87-1157(+)